MMKLILSVVLAFFLSQACASDWVSVRSGIDGVSLHKKEVAGKKYQLVKGEVTINAPFRNVVRILMAQSYAKYWAYQVKEVTLLEKNNPNFELGYWHTGAPWPVSDRDLVMRGSVSQDPKTLEVTFKLQADDPTLAPTYPDRVRITDMQESIRAIPLEDNKTKVIIELYFDPAGSIPERIVAATALESPKNTLNNLRRILEADAKKNSIRYDQLQTDGFYKLNMKKIKTPNQQ